MRIAIFLWIMVPFYVFSDKYNAYENGVIDTKVILLNDIKNPYNSSLFQYQDGYALVFREDVNNNKLFSKAKFSTRIGIVKLTKKFQQSSPCIILDTKSNYSEDPRIIEFKEKLFLIYNDIIEGDIKRRGIYFAELSSDLTQIVNIYPPFIQPRAIEKNWAPFISEDSCLNVTYQVYPHTIYKFDLDKNGCLYFLNEKINNKRFPSKIIGQWEEMYGQLRGGTPSVRVGDKLISFFHSSKSISNTLHKYFFGAIAYEAEYPYDIVAISPRPIYFKHIYRSKLSSFADKNKLVIFPCGIVDSGDELIVSLGENDSVTKIVTFSKQQLLNSMLHVK